MFSPRVLITTYHNAYLVRGGGEFEIISIADSLKKKGAIADLYGPYSRTIENYDVILHFSIRKAGLDLLHAVHAAGKPIVLWPNLWVTRDLSPAELVAEHVALAQRVVFKSQAEKEHFCALFPIPQDKIGMVPAGVDSDFEKPAPPGLFSSLYGLKEYAIWFGIIEPVKNQLMAIRALKRLEIPLVLVGKYRDQDYFDACKREAHNVTFIEGVPYKSEIARSALQDSLFYIEISDEPPGLSALSAGLAGCKLVLSDSSWTREHFGECTTYVDPHSLDSVCNGVQEAMSSPVHAEKLRKRMQRHRLPGAINPLLEILSVVAGKR